MNTPKIRNENIVVQEMEKEILIYDLKINKAYCLNETSAMVYQLCDGTKTVTEISQILSKKLKQPITEDVIWLALDGFKKDNLLEQSEQFEIDFGGLSRRQVIKKVGFASIITLPLIASLVAPSAITALSLTCAHSGQSCTGAAPLGNPLVQGSCCTSGCLCNPATNQCAGNC